MTVAITKLLKIKVRSWEPKVRFCVHPNFEWIPAGDHDPLPNVELTALDD